MFIPVHSLLLTRGVPASKGTVHTASIPWEATLRPKRLVNRMRSGANCTWLRGVLGRNALVLVCAPRPSHSCCSYRTHRHLAFTSLNSRNGDLSKPEVPKMFTTRFTKNETLKTQLSGGKLNLYYLIVSRGRFIIVKLRFPTKK